MIADLLLAWAVVAGVDLRRVGLLAAVAHLPVAVAGLLVLAVLRGRPDEDHRPLLFCEAVAAELRAGASLRQALMAAADSVGGMVLTAEAPIGVLVGQVERGLPGIGREVALTVTAAARTGADAAALFDEIGSLALAQAETRREVRVATALGRATALVLVAAPVVYVIGRLGSGELADLLASPHQRLAAIAGLGLFLTGLALASLVLWRARG